MIWSTKSVRSKVPTPSLPPTAVEQRTEGILAVGEEKVSGMEVDMVAVLELSHHKVKHQLMRLLWTNCLASLVRMKGEMNSAGSSNLLFALKCRSKPDDQERSWCQDRQRKTTTWICLGQTEEDEGRLYDATECSSSCDNAMFLRFE